jgi:hypothetical protein
VVVISINILIASLIVSMIVFAQLVAADMINSSRPMDRLICGDVGFGKTEVAIRAIYRAVQSGKQVRRALTAYFRPSI